SGKRGRRPARHHDLARRGHRQAHDVVAETHAGFARPDHVAGADPDDAALAVEADVDEEIAAGHQGDVRVLLVDRVADEDAAVGLGVFQELRAVPDLDRLQGCDAWTNYLAPAGVAGHQVRFDQARGDRQVGP